MTSDRIAELYRDLGLEDEQNRLYFEGLARLQVLDLKPIATYEMSLASGTGTPVRSGTEDAFLDAQEAQEEEIELRQATRLARLREALEDYNRMYHLMTRYWAN
jgi:hypothetical protein